MATLNDQWLDLVRTANRRTRDSARLRAVAIEAYKASRRLNRFLPPPKVLMNGPGKSGTHLLSDCLFLLPKMTFSGTHFSISDYLRTRDELDPAVEKAFSRCPNGMYVTTHARYHPALAEIISRQGFKHLLIVRDPRDILVSQVFWVLKQPNFYHYDFFAHQCRTDEERISVFVERRDPEVPGRPGNIPLLDNVAAFLPWLQDPSVHVVRFEDLAARGTTDAEAVQRETVRGIASFVERPLDDARLRAVAAKMYGKGGLTFRKGQAGDWRNHFTEAHKQAFKESTGDLLVRLGYEQDDDW